jgi:hypothetical protein
MIRKIIFVIILCFSLSADATPSIERLIGNIDVTYQIRSDILLYINNSVPTFSNSWKALIKIAQNQNFLYYHAKTYSEANNAVIETSTAQRCLNMEYNDGSGYHLFKKIEMMMSDTNERKVHIFEVSNYFFGRRGFTHLKINKEELAYRCDSGNYG